MSQFALNSRKGQLTLESLDGYDFGISKWSIDVGIFKRLTGFGIPKGSTDFVISIRSNNKLQIVWWLFDRSLQVTSGL